MVASLFEEMLQCRVAPEAWQNGPGCGSEFNSTSVEGGQVSLSFLGFDWFCGKSLDFTDSEATLLRLSALTCIVVYVPGCRCRPGHRCLSSRWHVAVDSSQANPFKTAVSHSWSRAWSTNHPYGVGYLR